MAENHNNKTLFSHTTRLLKKASNLYNKGKKQADLANALKLSNVANSSQNEQSRIRTNKFISKRKANFANMSEHLLKNMYNMNMVICVANNDFKAKLIFLSINITKYSFR